MYFTNSEEKGEEEEDKKKKDKIGCLERVGFCNKVMGHKKGAYFLDYACV